MEEKRKLKGITTAVAASLVVLLITGLQAAKADTVDPQIYVCTGCTAPPGDNPNIINVGSINIGFAGNQAAVSPLLVIVGVPNLGSAPTISLPGGVLLAAAANYYGANTNNSTTGELDGTLSYTTTTDAYTAVGISGSGGGASEHGQSWATFDTSQGISLTSGSSFNLYVYAIDFALNSGPGGNSPIDIDFSGATNGSYVIAYNCAVSGTSCSGGDIGATPFSNAGDDVSTPTPTPEPASVALFGLGLLGVGFWLKRRGNGPHFRARLDGR